MLKMVILAGELATVPEEYHHSSLEKHDKEIWTDLKAELGYFQQ